MAVFLEQAWVFFCFRFAKMCNREVWSRELSRLKWSNSVTAEEKETLRKTEFDAELQNNIIQLYLSPLIWSSKRCQIPNWLGSNLFVVDEKYVTVCSL